MTFSSILNYTLNHPFYNNKILKKVFFLAHQHDMYLYFHI